MEITTHTRVRRKSFASKVKNKPEEFKLKARIGKDGGLNREMCQGNRAQDPFEDSATARKRDKNNTKKRKEEMRCGFSWRKSV